MLTERAIRDAKPGPKTELLWDAKIKGFGLRIAPGGVKAFVLDYRDAAGKKRRATLGRIGEMTLREARARAGRELAAIRDGDPGPLARRRELAAAPTVADGLRQFFLEYCPRRIADGRMTESTAAEYGRQAKRHIGPALGDAKITAVRRLDVERMVDGLPPASRNRTLAFASRLFSYFEAQEWRPQSDNPVKRIERAREEPRDRVLAPRELAALARALDGVAERSPSSAAAIRFAALTGLRIGEILRIEWEHVDFDARRVVLPETKSGRRQHDLPTAALALLADLPRINRWCFAGGRGAAVTYRTVRGHFKAAAAEAGLGDARIHDLRRTVMTSAAAAGVGTHVLRDLLGHKTTAMADRYIRAVGDPVREAREQVGGAMAAMMADG